ncbi:MAG: hypothetical protein K9L79_04565 [Methylobacter tundripaludum]|nr:hypothetical protein [Methylobacter tundripaludum]
MGVFIVRIKARNCGGVKQPLGCCFAPVPDTVEGVCCAKDVVKNNFPKSPFSLVKPFVLSPSATLRRALSKHDRLDAAGRNFSAHPSTSSGRTEKFHPFNIGKLLLTIS